MGSSQSGEIFYDCDVNVGTFISNRPEHLKTLKKTVENFADLENIVNGQVKLKAKPNTATTAKDECQKKLDSFFDQFLSFEEKLESSTSHSDLNSFLTFQNFKCCTKPVGNALRITGVSSDVKSLVSAIRDFQSPSSSSSLSSSSSHTTSKIKSSNLVSSTSTVQISQINFDDANTPSTISSKQTPYRQSIESSRFDHIVLSSSSSAESSSESSSSDNKDDDEDDDEDDIYDFSSNHADELLPLDYKYTYSPPDFSVARFIKYSREHTNKLKNVYDSFASAVVFEEKTKKTVEYQFQPKRFLKMKKKKFNRVCQKRLLIFLKDYHSIRRRFNRERLSKAENLAPQHFCNMSGRDNGELHVQWHMDNGLVVITGLKKKVEDKATEIDRIMDEIVPKPNSARRIFKVPAPDFSVARFLQQSKSHSSKFESVLEDFATLKLWNVPSDNRSGGNERPNRKIIEYQFKPISGLDLSDEEFRRKCKTTLNDFLGLYSSARKFFNHDHLMKAAAQDQEFFARQSAEEKESLFVEWRLDKNKVSLTGLKCDVDDKLQEITTHLDNLVPRTMKELYEFDMDPPHLVTAQFIKERRVHLNSLRSSITNARLWITPGECKLHFKANDQMQQQEIPAFEESCKNAAIEFFKKIYVWKPSFPASAVKATLRSNPELFVNTEINYQAKVVEDQIVLVGIKPFAYNHQSAIHKAVDRNDAIIKAKTQSRGRQRKESGEPSTSIPSSRSRSRHNHSTENALLLRPFVYEPKAKANLNILKHIFQSPVDLEYLQRQIGSHVKFEAFPNTSEPLRLKFCPSSPGTIDVRYYIHEMPSKVAEFFGRFLVCRRQCRSYEEEQVFLRAVYGVGQTFSVPENGISIHRGDGFLNIVGRRHAMSELAHVIDGTKCEGTKVSLRQLPCPSGPRRVSVSSEADHVDAKNIKSNKANPKKSKASEKSNAANNAATAAAKSNEVKKKNILYNPKKHLLSKFTFVWENSRFREELKSRCSDLCVLSGSSKPVKITPKNPEDNAPLLTKKVVEKIEDFLDLISLESVSLDADLIKLFEDEEEKLLKDVPQDRLVINLKEDKIELSGYTDDVIKYKSVLESHFEEVTSVIETSSEITKVLTVCGVIAEANRQLKDKVQIKCNIDKGTVEITGRKCSIENAQSKLGEIGQLVEKTPLMSEAKLKALISMKKKEGDEMKLIEKEMKDKNIKCVLLLQPNEQLILTAMTNEMFKKGAKFLDRFIVSEEIPKPDELSSTIFEDKPWDDLVRKLTRLKTLFISTQDTSVTLCGLTDQDVKSAASKIKEFFESSMKKAREIKCASRVRRFILQYYPQPNLIFTETKQGLQISGPAQDVDSFIDELRNIVWSRCQFTYTSPDLVSHFNSSSWKGFVTILEKEVRCTVDCEVSKSSEEGEESETISPFTRSRDQANFSSSNVKEAAYGQIKVSVCHGDISSDNSDVIVNGVISTDFNLSRGAVSSTLLRRAGGNLQIECDKAPKTSPVIRHTRGCNLLCNHVIHVVTPNQSDVLTKRLKDVLDHAELLKAQSVAIPTLGAGGIGLAAADVASAMTVAFELFAQEKPRYVRSIKVVVYDLPIVGLFQTSIIQEKELMDFGRQAIDLSEVKSKSLLHDEVTLHVNCNDPQALKKAKEQIEEYMSNVIVTKTIKVDYLSELDNHDQCDIYEAAAKFKAEVTFNSITSEIILKGLNVNVSQLYDMTRELVFELREAITLSKMFVWKWATSSNLFTALPLRVSRALEKEYENKTSGPHHVTMYGSYLGVDFSRMTYTFKNISGKLKREDSEKIPSSWSDMMGKPWLKISLDSNSSEYKRVVTQFQASNPQYNHIVDIERIQNPSLYKQYLIKKNDVQRHMRSKEPVERELFHGTSSADAEKICADNFDRSYSGKNATVYGKGCYFAVDSSYSVPYASNQLTTVNCIFLAQVVTGDFCQGNSSLVSPPDKPHVGDTSRKYDSVVNNESSPTMFVVFKDTSVYPAYLISFR